MILEYKVNGRRVDTVTVSDDFIAYETGAARSTIETKIDSLGRKQAMKEFRSWSNGYVSISEIVR